MTELNNFPETDSDLARISWPAAPAGAVNGTVNGTTDGLGGSPGGDASVDAVLGRLADIPELPVSGHAEAYSDLHDALLDALNEANPSAAGDT
jgi:hypothetical protein